MSTAEGYEGGAVGKLRTRQRRRAPATPYDRPPAAARGLRDSRVDGEAEAGSRSGWVSKLLDPASALIAKGATRLFSTVFRKQLGPFPPPESLVANFQPGQAVPDVSNPNHLLEMQEQGSKRDDNSRDQSNNDGISELEQLLKQKTFTRDEYDRLVELLRSRTVDLPNEDENKRIEPGNSHASDLKEQADQGFGLHEDRLESSKFGDIISTSGDTLKILEEELAAPVEVAKAYMGSRPSKVHPSSLTMQSQMPREAAASPSFIGCAPKSATSMHSKSVSHFSGVSGTRENGYIPPRSQGRSAICKMSRCTYLKSEPTVTHKDGGEPIGGGYPGPPTSMQWTPVNFTFHTGKQVLKRRSVFESDLGSIRVMHRNRRKSSLVSSFEEIISESPGKFLPTENTLVSVQRSSSMQRPIPLCEQKHDTSNGYASVPLQSREMAKRILQQLDKLVPSPKAESTEAKTISRDESLPNLRRDMLLHEQTSKSVAEINASKLLNMEVNSKLESPNNFHVANPRSAISLVKGKADNGASRPILSETKTASEANGVVSVVTLAAETEPVKGFLDSVFAHSTVGPLQKKSAFKMQAPADTLEQVGDMYRCRDVLCPSASAMQKAEMDDHKVVISETKATEKPFAFSSESISTSNITFNEVVGNGVSNGPIVADKDTSVAFEVSLPSSIQCQASVSPTMPSRSVEESITSSEEIDVPLFTFGSKSPPLTFSLSVMSTSDSAGLKFVARSNLEGKLIGSSAITAGTTAPMRFIALDKAEKLSGNSSSLVFSASTTSNSSQFVACATPRQSYGSLTSDSSIFSVSSVSAASLPGNLATVSVSPLSNSGNERSSSPTFSALSSFQFGASSSAVSTDSSLVVVKSTSTDLGSKVVKELPFCIVSSVAAAVSTFSSASTSIFGSNTTASSGTISGSSGSVFGSQSAQSGSGTSCFVQSAANHFGHAASTFGSGSSSFAFSSSAFGSSTSNVKPFGLSSGIGPSSSVSFLAAGSSIPGSSPFVPTLAATSVFGSSSQSPVPSVFGSRPGPFEPSMVPTFRISSATSAATFVSSAMPPFRVSSCSSTSSFFSFTQPTATSSSEFTFTSGVLASTASLSSRSNLSGKRLDEC